MKINVYTTLAVHGGQALARSVLHNLPGIFDEAQLRELVGAGVLAETAFPASVWEGAKPKLAIAANPTRRDAWFTAVKDRCQDFLEAFNYRAFAR